MRLRNSLLGFVLALLLLVGLLQTPAHAQTFKVLHDFFGGIDGYAPLSHLVRDSAGNLYGTASYAAPSGSGTVFKLDPSTNSLKTLHQFSGPDGAAPWGGLVLDANGFLYGTTYGGGTSALSEGTIFKMDTSGGQFQTLHNFVYEQEGGYPYAGLLLDGQGHLYGTTSGGAGFGGSVFRIDTSGANLQVLHYFDYNAEGGALSGLVLDNQGILYGSAEGGSSGNGTVYALDAQGNNFHVLHSFTGTDGSSPNTLALDSQGTLYGTASQGGNGGSAGVVFAIDTSGNNFSVLHDFNDGSGIDPTDGLLLDNGNLYGTTENGGSSDSGEIFTLTTSGTNFQVLHNFTGSDGYSPAANDVGLLLDDKGVLYGAARSGGANNIGVVFALLPGNVPASYVNVNVANVAATIGQTVTLNAVLRHPADDTLLSGQILSFYGLDGSYLGDALTNGNGIASLDYYVPDTLAVGSLPFRVQSLYDPPYQAAVGQSWLTLSPGDIYFVVKHVSGVIGQTVPLSAVFYRTADNTPLANKTVQVYVGAVGAPHIGNPHVGSALTDANGVATFNYKIPDDFTAGEQPILFQRFADAYYNTGTGSNTLTVLPSHTYFTVSNVSAARGQTVSLSAVFYLASDNAALPHKTVSFGIDGVHIADTVTDGTGTATFSYTIPTTMSLGKHTIMFTRFADNQYTGGYSTGTLTVTP